MNEISRCWCGNLELITFSPEYRKCPVCETLVSKFPSPQPVLPIIDDQRDFYGREYWFTHQERDLSFPNIVDRARADLSERCLHWLRSILRFKLPPAHLLELGSAHGGFVALLRWAGYDAIGLEMSPWIVDYARRTFDVPMLLGPVEDQQIELGTQDMIALLDVLEHLPDPVGTMRHCLGLLKSEGAMTIQTPRYLEGKTYDEMVAQGDCFLGVLKANEHLYLFSEQSIREFFRRLGADYLQFEPPIFDQYDMFLIVSRLPIPSHDSSEIEKALCLHPSGRIILALLDLYAELKESEADRNARFRHIEELSRLFKESEQDRAARLNQINQLAHLLKESEEDRAARLGQINQLTHLLKESEEDRAGRINQMEKLLQLVARQNDLLESTQAKLAKLNGLPEVRFRKKLSRLLTTN